uniref:Docking protein 2 n=1 Tax=Seriola lalandi dorsalis TaxID=1841481 RepID=A0A3B4XSW2_SERLL
MYSTFSFEAGRRCESGEGSFEFDTKQGNFLFQAVEAAINLQRISLPHRQTSGGGLARGREGTAWLPPAPLLRSPPRSRNILSSHPARSCESSGDPLYDSIDEMKIRNVFLSDADALGPTYGKVEHIYDEPEGCAATAGASGGQKSTGPPSVYDDPEEMRGDAWRIMGTAADPKGHEYPYNPRVDDYAVPKRPQRAAPSPGSALLET